MLLPDLLNEGRKRECSDKRKCKKKCKKRTKTKEKKQKKQKKHTSSKNLLVHPLLPLMVHASS